MVKGVSKKIVLVPSPDKKLFEQAIFIVSDTITDENDVLDRAMQVAESYLKKQKGINYKLRYCLCALSGFLLMGAIWFSSIVIF
ncbi:MAG: hypothetical protein R3Y09_02755 [Clostridia bacterium]